MTPPGRSSKSSVAIACLLLAAIGSVAALLYCLPPRLVGAMGLAIEGGRHFQETVPLTRRLPEVSENLFVWLFRALIGVAWVAWIRLVSLGFRGRLPSRRAVIALVTIGVLILAFLCPPVLSRDVYAYVAYGRLSFLYGANPYVNDRAVLQAAGDQAAGFLVWSSPLPYGPLWTIIATALASCGNFGGLYGEVVAHKLLSGVMLIAAAVGAARLAEQRESGRGRLTFLAIALNPLLLLEGPGTGHNDLVMIAFLIWGAVFFARRQRGLAALFVGLAIGVKPVAVVAVPAFLLEEWLGETSQRRWLTTVRDAALAAAPFVLLSLPFGGPVLVARSFLAQGGAPLGSLGLALGTAIGLSALAWAWRVVSTNVHTLEAAWLVAWIPLSIVVVLVGTRQWFPWYVSWALVPALAGWDERHRILTTGAVAFGVLLTVVYTYRP